MELVEGCSEVGGQGPTAVMVCWPEPRCSISREPQREEYTAGAAVAPEAVFTVRTFGTGPLYSPRLSARIGPAKSKNKQVSQP